MKSLVVCTNHLYFCITLNLHPSQFANPDSQSQMFPSPNSKYVHPDPRSPSSGDVVHAPLSAENYKIKFTELLKLDNIEHERVLDEK